MLKKFIVCQTKEDVRRAQMEYVEQKRLRLSLKHCVFQRKHQTQQSKQTSQIEKNK